MGKLLTILGVSEEQQAKLPDVIFKGEKVVDGLQRVYAASPESPKKDQLAKAISESVKILMAKVQPYLIDEKKEEQTKKEDEKLPEEHKKPTPPQPKPEEPKRKQKPTPPPSTPEPPKPTPPKPPQPKPEEPPHKATEEPMTCDEIKDAIKGLTLIAKMGDSEAADIIKQLKIKLKTQNCK